MVKLFRFTISQWIFLRLSNQERKEQKDSKGVKYRTTNMDKGEDTDYLGSRNLRNFEAYPIEYIS